MDFDIELGNRIRAVRHSRNMTQERLSEMAGISLNYLSRVERGKTRLSCECLDQIAKALSISINRLWYDAEDRSHADDSILDREVFDELSDCSEKEKESILELIRAGKKIIRSHQDGNE